MDKYLTNRIWTGRLIVTIIFAFIIGCVPPEEDPDRQIIQEIVDVQLSIVNGQSQQLEIMTSGNVSSAGWSNPVLVPHEYIVPPDDGIYEYTFYATPPKEIAATVITSIDATYHIKPLPDNLKGVRVYSETNDKVVMLDVQKPSPVSAIVDTITDVQLNRVNSNPARIDISVKGTVSSAGWSHPVLIAYQYILPPQDGIYDFTFYATPPKEPGATVITPIEVSHRLNVASDNFKGVRIHSATNNIEVMLEAQIPPPASTIINGITDVQLSVLQGDPRQLVINVSGTVDSAGWTQSVLVPHEYLVPPQDGIYEFTYYATPPVEPGKTIITPIDVTHILAPLPADLTGVRIYSETNNVEAVLNIDKPVPDRQAINEITGVQLSLLNGSPRQLEITVTGNVTGAGWSSPMLIPFQYIVAPQDGIYDFTFYATPPGEAGSMVITPIDVTHRLTSLSDNLKGIRIHSATNNIVAMLDAQPPAPVPEIIYEITDVQVSIPANLPDQLDINVKGLVNSGGWSQPELIAHEYLVPPQDGIYDFTFYATPPAGASSGAFARVEVFHRLGQLSADLTGIRIHSKTNNIVILLNDPAQLALNKNKRLWRDSGITSYQYTFQRSCFCVPTEDIVVIVSSGAVMEAFYTPGGSPLTPLELAGLMTVEELFSTIQRALNSDTSTVAVDYNAGTGYPEQVSVDWIVMAVDDEITYFVKDLQPR